MDRLLSRFSVPSYSVFFCRFIAALSLFVSVFFCIFIFYFLKFSFCFPLSIHFFHLCIPVFRSLSLSFLFFILSLSIYLSLLTSYYLSLRLSFFNLSQSLSSCFLIYYYFFYSVCPRFPIFFLSLFFNFPLSRSPSLPLLHSILASPFDSSLPFYRCLFDSYSLSLCLSTFHLPHSLFQVPRLKHNKENRVASR